MSEFLPRLAATPLHQALEVMPVVVLTGGGQTAKSTLVQTLPELADRMCLTLDDLDVRGQAQTNPDELLGRAPLLMLDEVKREPGIFMAIKRRVDRQRPRQPDRFVLTGSANLLLMRTIAGSLAGRASYVSLWPLTRRERLGQGHAGIRSRFFDTPLRDWPERVGAEVVPKAEVVPVVPKEEWQTSVRLGGYPVPAHELKTAQKRRVWFGGYAQTYLERDLQELASINSLADFQRFVRAASLRIGNLINHAEIGRDSGIPRPTIQLYMNLLETSYQIIRVEPYSVNRTKQLIKTAKLYWDRYRAGNVPQWRQRACWNAL